MKDVCGSAPIVHLPGTTTVKKGLVFINKKHFELVLDKTLTNQVIS